jgi:hypothetical protein
MARDLRHEFYELFDPFLEATKTLMRVALKTLRSFSPANLLFRSSNDPDTIDALFSTLAFVFKFLVKQIVMNFQVSAPHKFVQFIYSLCTIGAHLLSLAFLSKVYGFK